MLISIDPGVENLAFAFFDEALLVGAHLSRCTKSEKSNIGYVMRKHAQAVSSYLHPRVDPCVVLEEMRHYPNAKAKDAKAVDLLHLAAIGGFVAGSLTSSTPRLVSAFDWKGTVTKDITKRRVLQVLSAEESARLRACLAPLPASLHHNVYDAVGIGLYALGRGIR